MKDEKRRTKRGQCNHFYFPSLPSCDKNKIKREEEQESMIEEKRKIRSNNKKKACPDQKKQ